MGRHSVPDDDAPDVASTPRLIVDPSLMLGRHSRGEEDPTPDLDNEDTQVFAVVRVEPQSALPGSDLGAEPSAATTPDATADDSEMIPAPLAPLFEDETAAATAAAGPAAFDIDAMRPAVDAASLQAAAELTAAQEAAAFAAAKAATSSPKQQAKQARRDAKAAAKEEAKAHRGETNTQADLRLLRANPILRAQCIGAVLLVFAVYSGVMFAIQRTDVYVLWLWIPIVVSCVAFGALLDLAHRRAVEATPPDSP